MVIKWNKELEEVLNTVNEHLVKACEMFTENNALFDNNDKVYYRQCACIMNYDMLTDMLDDVIDFTVVNRDNSLDMKRLGTLLCKLIVVENTTEECCEELLAFGIDGEEVLEELCRASTPLEKFVWRLIPPVNNEEQSINCN